MNRLMGLLFSGFWAYVVYLYVAENFSGYANSAYICGGLVFIIGYMGWNWWSVENDPIVRHSRQVRRKQANYRKNGRI
jgi:hypothetical protein